MTMAGARPRAIGGVLGAVVGLIGALAAAWVLNGAGVSIWPDYYLGGSPTTITPDLVLAATLAAAGSGAVLANWPRKMPLTSTLVMAMLTDLLAIAFVGSIGLAATPGPQGIGALLLEAAGAPVGVALAMVGTAAFVAPFLLEGAMLWTVSVRRALGTAGEADPTGKDLPRDGSTAVQVGVLTAVGQPDLRR